MKIANRFSTVARATAGAALLALPTAASGQCEAAWLAASPGIPGPSAEVDALTVYNGSLIVGGDFTGVGNPALVANYIASWNGTTWGVLGQGFNDTVLALAVYHGQLIAAGLFTGNGPPGPPQLFGYIARWDAANGWQPLGVGLSDPVLALAVYNDDLIVGGVFLSAGGSANLAIARWHDDGPGTPGTWSSFGDGLGGQFGAGVYALTVYNNEVIAGGEFDTAGGITVNRLARGNGVNWQGLSGGVNSSVLALISHGGNLVAGGVLGSAGTAPPVPASHIARWNGTTWTAKGTGTNNNVVSFGILGTTLFAGGQFTMAGGQSASRIAKWDGGAWSALGAGVNNTAFAMSAYQGDLYVGGSFTMAGGQAFPYLARWRDRRASCPADFDCNNAVQPGDVATFVNTWFASLTGGTLAGDFDGNGAVQPADVAAFVQVWFTAVAQGC